MRLKVREEPMWRVVQADSTVCEVQGKLSIS